MADFFKWDPRQLSVNVNEMDSEHQVLIQKMNALHEANAKKAPRETLSRLVDDFAAYTVKHFTDEEAYMQKVGFDGLETHKIIHKQLLGQVQEHLEKFKATGELTPAFFNFLSVWLTSHIRGIDTKYGAVKKKAS